MCCRRRQNRAPVLVTLGKMAYDKYQQHQANKLQSAPLSSSPTPEMLQDQANNEILGKAGLLPPSYDEVVNRAEPPRYQVNVSEKAVKDEKPFIDDMTNLESINHVPNGLQAPESYCGPIQAIPAPSPRRGCCSRDRDYGGYSSRCEQKRAERMARKAEKQAAKLARVQGQM